MWGFSEDKYRFMMVVKVKNFAFYEIFNTFARLYAYKLCVWGLTYDFERNK